MGKSFHIIDNYGFCEIVLPRYFKHKNIASFVRQLNLCNFFCFIFYAKLNIVF